MKTEFRYILDKSSRKFICPECETKRFVKYIDVETGQYLPAHYGRCDKGDGHYFLDPYTDGYAKDNIKEKETFHKSIKPRLKTVSQRTKPAYFDFETYKQTLEPKRYDQNVFIQNLLKRVPYPFKVEDVTKAIQFYRLGTIANGYRKGAIAFPFIDVNGNVRAVQIKQFDNANHTTGTDFLHSIIEKHFTRNSKPLPDWLEAYIKQDKRVSCLFGEHLLRKYPYNPVALVEAPKTAIYGALYFGFPESNKDLIWLAVYNKSSFSKDKIEALKGRDIITFPDLSEGGITFNEWEKKASQYENELSNTRFIFSDLLEQIAPKKDREQGKDIADYLIQLDWRLFRKQPIQELTYKEQPQTIAVKVPQAAKEPKKDFLTIDESFIIEARKDYSQAQILQAIAETKPTKEPKAILNEMIADKRLHWCKVTNSIYYIPF